MYVQVPYFGSLSRITVGPSRLYPDALSTYFAEYSPLARYSLISQQLLLLDDAYCSNTETLRCKDVKYSTNDKQLAKNTLRYPKGVTNDEQGIFNLPQITVQIFLHQVATPRVHELFAQVMSGKFVPDTSHEWSILVLTLHSLRIDIPDSCKHAKI